MTTDRTLAKKPKILTEAYRPRELTKDEAIDCLLQASNTLWEIDYKPSRSINHTEYEAIQNLILNAWSWLIHSQPITELESHREQNSP